MLDRNLSDSKSVAREAVTLSRSALLDQKWADILARKTSKLGTCKTA